jgi:hypothetical protein
VVGISSNVRLVKLILIPIFATIWIADAHRDGKLFVVRADEKLIAFVELAWPIRLDAKSDTQIVFPEES